MNAASIAVRVIARRSSSSSPQVARAAGVRVTLGSDDPPYWQATIGGEYEIARREWGLTDAELRAITRTALEGAFVDEATRISLLARSQD